MSLKGFHILFIALALLCTAGFWGWTAVYGEQAREAGLTSLGNFSGSLALALLFYGVWFVARKSKTILV